MKKKTTGSWTDWKGEVTELPKLFLQDEINPFYGVENADEFTWKLHDPSKPIEITKVLEDGTTLKVKYDPPVNIDNLSEDIYVQHIDGLGDDSNSITLGYQITKEEFEELIK